MVQFHSDNFVLDERIKQPTEVKIFAYQIFIFTSPVQDEVRSSVSRQATSNVNKFLPQDAIREIYLAGGKIFLEAYRPKDRQSSNVKVEFEFKVKEGNNVEIFY